MARDRPTSRVAEEPEAPPTDGVAGGRALTERAGGGTDRVGWADGPGRRIAGCAERPIKVGAPGVVTPSVTAYQRCTTAAAVTLALVGALAVAAPATPDGPTVADPATASGRPLAVGAVDVPIQPDEGGHRIGDDGEHDHGDGGAQADHVLYGTRWNDPDLTYGFVNHTPDLSESAQEAAIRSAFDSWASVSALTFTEVPDCGLPFDAAGCTEPDIRIQFGSGSHSGSSYDPAFDGPGGTAGHAFYPPPNGASAAGDLHLDEGERWTTSGGGVDLQSIALHELGHSLGLGHPPSTQCPNSTSATRPIMCSTIIGVDRTLAPDDIGGIQRLYGLPGLACGGRAVTVDLNEGGLPTSGPDVILGTPGSDRIVAGGGADIVCGQGGHDVIDLGPGNDQAFGGSGNDRLIGRSGNDRLEGGGGNDTVLGGGGSDRLYGATGADTVDGGTNADKLYGGAQSDNCNGRGGRDAQTGCERRTSIESRIR